MDNFAALKSMHSAQANRLSAALSEAISVGKEWGLDEEIIENAEVILLKLELLQELIQDFNAARKAAPMRAQDVYINHIFKLESSMRKATEAGLEASQLDEAARLIQRCQSEYWLSVLQERLSDVITAEDSNEHDMNKLRKAIERAEAVAAADELLDQAKKFLQRLDSELGMSRAIAAMPSVRLPIENPPEGYWTEDDTGTIEETEGYPAPPTDNNGEYKWIPSKTFTALGAGIERLSASYTGSDALGANPGIIQQSKETLAKAEKDFKVLEVKDQADKALAIEAAKKALKKLKKGGKKK